MDENYLKSFRLYCNVLQRIIEQYQELKKTFDNFEYSEIDKFQETISYQTVHILSDIFTIACINEKTGKFDNNSGILLLKDNSKIMKLEFENLENYLIIRDYIKIDDDYNLIAETNLLKSMKIIRNKYEHRLHEIKLKGSVGSKSDIYLYYEYDKRVYEISIEYVNALIKKYVEIFNKLLNEIKENLDDKFDENYKNYYLKLKIQYA